MYCSARRPTAECTESSSHCGHEGFRWNAVGSATGAYPQGVSVRSLQIVGGYFGDSRRVGLLSSYGLFFQRDSYCTMHNYMNIFMLFSHCQCNQFLFSHCLIFLPYCCLLCDQIRLAPMQHCDLL